MRRIFWLILIAVVTLTIASNKASAQLPLGHYSRPIFPKNQQTLDISRVSTGEQITSLTVVTYVSGGGVTCTGRMTFKWDFLIKETYSGQNTSSSDNPRSGALSCNNGATIVPGGPTTAVCAFSANSLGQVIVSGTQGVAGTYNPGKPFAQALDLNFPFELDDLGARFKYVIKKRGEPTRLVEGPLSRLYQEISK